MFLPRLHITLLHSLVFKGKEPVTGQVGAIH